MTYHGVATPPIRFWGSVNKEINSEIEVTRNTTQDFLEKDPPLSKTMVGACHKKRLFVPTSAADI